MTSKQDKYTLEDVYTIMNNGFNFLLPDKTIKTINDLSKTVGSRDYVKTPIFKKNDNQIVQVSKEKKDKRKKVTEITNDDDWNTLNTNTSSFQTTKINEKVGIDAQIDTIRNYLNKLTEKNYFDISDKIVDIINKLRNEEHNSQNDIYRFSSVIFDIASTNKFYSKIYADLYALLCSKYNSFKLAFEKNFNNFVDLFNTIEYVDPTIDYNKFCEINKINDKRKALASFYLNLMNNNIITSLQIMQITRNILFKINDFIVQENKKTEVDELTETISILYKKDIYKNDKGDNYEKIEGLTINEIIEKIVKNNKDYKSLSKKSLFKFMDLNEM